MSYDIGPRLGIEGEAAFKQSIAAVNAQLKSMGAEMKAVVSSYEEGDRSAEALAARNEVLGRTAEATKQKMALLQTQYDKQKDKLAELGAALEAATQEYGENSAEAIAAQNAYNRQAVQVSRLGEQLNGATADLNRMEQEMERNRREMDGMDDSLGDMGDAAEDAGGRLDALTVAAGNLIADGIRAAAAAIGDMVSSLVNLDESTEEYRASMGKLNTAFETAGYGADTAQRAYTEFYGILGDTDTATEASQLLAKLADSEADLSTWTRAAAGVWGTFGDSLPIEGLIESSNETAKVGQVTGALADALNWAGISEDDFNEKLEACSSESERNKLIMDTLSSTYGEASDAFYRNNDALVASRENQAAMDQSLGALGGTIAGMKNSVMTELTPALSGMVSAFNDALNGVAGVDGQFGAAISGLVTAVLEKIPEFLSAGTQILTSLLSGIGQALPLIIPAAAQTVTAIIQGLVDSIPLLLDAAIPLMQGLAQGIMTAIPVLLEAVPGIITGLVASLLEEGTQLVYIGTELFQSLVDGLPEIISTIVAVIPDIIDGIMQAVKDNICQIVTVGTELISSLVEDLPTIISAVTGALPELISGIVDTLMDSLPTLIETGVELLTSLIDNLPAIITGIASAIPTLVTGIASAITGNIDKIIVAGVQLLVALIQNLPAIIVGIVKAVPEIINGIVSAFGALAGDIIEIGGDLLHGIWEGIQNTGDWLWNQVKGFFGGILDSIKEFLGIHSPSRVFAEFGVMSMKGFAVGMKDEGGNTIKTAAELSEAILKSATEWVGEKKGYDQLTAKQEVEFWEEMKSIAGLGAKELEEIDQKLYTARKNASKESYDYSKKWIEEEKFYNRLSAQEEAEAWERVASRKNLLAGEQAQAEKSLYTARQNLAKEQNDLLKKQADEEEKLYQKQMKAVEAYEKAVESRAGSLRSFAGLFDEIKRDADVSGTALLKNLRDQVAAFQNWQTDIEALTERGVTDGLLEELQDMGPKAADQIHALTTLTDKQLDEYIALFAEKGALAAEQAKAEIPPVEIPLKIAGGEEGAEGTAATTMTAFQTAIQNSLKDVTATGETVVHTLEEAMRATGGAIVDAAKELISRFCYTFGSRYSSFKNTGLNAMAGLTAGLWAGGQEAIQTARDIADSIIAEMDRALGIHSPSTVMAEMGGYMAQGLELGFTRSMEGVKSNMTKSMTPEAPALKAAEGTVNGIWVGLPA